MEKPRDHTGRWIFLAAVVLGICLVAAATINVLPYFLSTKPYEQQISTAPSVALQDRESTPEIYYSAPLTTINESFVEDKIEGKSPDFRKLIVSYDAELVYVTLVFNSGVNQLNGADFVYMYGTHHDMIRLSSGSFRLERDGGADGHFEEVVYSGSTEKIEPDSIIVEIPREYLPDISEKKIWGYSMQSQDRIPDKNELLLYTVTPTRIVTRAATPTPFQPISPCVTLKTSATALKMGETITVVGSSKAIGQAYYTVMIKEEEAEGFSNLATVDYLNKLRQSDPTASHMLELVSFQGNANRATAVLRARASGSAEVKMEINGENYCHDPGGSWTWAEYTESVVVTVSSSP